MNLLENSSYQVVKYSFLSLVYITFILPSGTIFGIPLKVFLLAIIGLGMLAVFHYQQRLCLNKSVAVFILLYSIVIISWSMLGYLYDVPSAYILQEAILLLTIPLLLLTTNVLIDCRIISIQNLCRHFIKAAICYAALKIIMEGMYYANIIDGAFIQNFIFDIFGTYAMVYPIGDVLTRISLVNDLSSLFICVNIIFMDKKMFGYKHIYIIVAITFLLFSIFISFSRAIWIILILLLCFGFLINKSYKQTAISIVFILAVMISIYGFLGDDITNRLNMDSDMNVQSDLFRFYQFTSLIEAFQESVYFGNGVGAYVHDNIRSDVTPFSYEMQMVSFLMKFGLVGCTILLASSLFYLRGLVIHGKKRYLFLIAQPMSIVVLSFSNPYITSSVTALILSFFFVLSKVLDNDRFIQ